MGKGGVRGRLGGKGEGGEGRVGEAGGWGRMRGSWGKMVGKRGKVLVFKVKRHGTLQYSIKIQPLVLTNQ